MREGQPMEEDGAADTPSPSAARGKTPLWVWLLLTHGTVVGALTVHGFVLVAEHGWQHVAEAALPRLIASVETLETCIEREARHVDTEKDVSSADATATGGVGACGEAFFDSVLEAIPTTARTRLELAPIVAIARRVFRHLLASGSRVWDRCTLTEAASAELTRLAKRLGRPGPRARPACQLPRGPRPPPAHLPDVLFGGETAPYIKDMALRRGHLEVLVQRLEGVEIAGERPAGVFAWSPDGARWDLAGLPNGGSRMLWPIWDGDRLLTPFCADNESDGCALLALSTANGVTVYADGMRYHGAAGWEVVAELPDGVRPERWASRDGPTGVLGTRDGEPVVMRFVGTRGAPVLHTFPARKKHREGHNRVVFFDGEEAILLETLSPKPETVMRACRSGPEPTCVEHPVGDGDDPVRALAGCQSEGVMWVTPVGREAVLRSTDGGRSWSSLASPMRHRELRSAPWTCTGGEFFEVRGRPAQLYRCDAKGCHPGAPVGDDAVALWYADDALRLETRHLNRFAVYAIDPKAPDAMTLRAAAQISWLHPRLPFVPAWRLEGRWWIDRRIY